jgi:hypothetical protein
LGSDKWYNPDHVHPDDEEFKSDRPSTTRSIRSRSDRRTTKFEKNKGYVQKDSVKGTGASSSGLTLEERARSLLLPTTDETEGVPCERADSQYQGDEGQGDSSSVPSTVEYPDNNAADLVVLNDRSLCIFE